MSDSFIAPQTANPQHMVTAGQIQNKPETLRPREVRRFLHRPQPATPENTA